MNSAARIKAAWRSILAAVVAAAAVCAQGTAQAQALADNETNQRACKGDQRIIREELAKLREDLGIHRFILMTLVGVVVGSLASRGIGRRGGAA